MATGEKSNYTRAQKRAYYSGMGYATAYHKKAIKFAKPENRESFEAGWKQGTAMAKQTPDKYPPLQTKKKTAKKSSAPRKKKTNKTAKKPYAPPAVIVEVK
ncbi:MAG: hypothetical protein ACI4SH_00700 [Candidatus Scatosoma sp.]